MRPLICSTFLTSVEYGNSVQLAFAAQNETPSQMTCSQIQIEIDVAQFSRCEVASIGRALGQNLPEADSPAAFVHSVGVAMRLRSHDQQQEHRVDQMSMCLALNRISEGIVSWAEKAKGEE
jgi:hypothetical protein